MTREDKELLLKDLCARLPYGVKVQCEDYLFTFDKDHMGIGMLYKDFNMNLLESPKIIFLEIQFLHLNSSAKLLHHQEHHLLFVKMHYSLSRQHH